VYRIDSLYRRTIWPNTQNEVTALLDEKKSQDTPNHRTYFPAPDEFFDTWIEWYKKWDSLFWNTIDDRMGFEMKYVNTDPKSEFFKIWEHIWINDVETRGIQVLAPIMLCADGNKIHDMSWHMMLLVNDTRDESVCMYSSEKKAAYHKIAKEDFHKPLLPPYQSNYPSDTRRKFPFDSPDPLVAWGNIWHIIGFSPLTVYEKLEKLGFIFGNKK
jgi:hypothetical protein